jgi:hypothetical protein
MRGAWRRCTRDRVSDATPDQLAKKRFSTCLALKTFFKTDYRGVVQPLRDFTELRPELGLNAVPHCSTLCYAAQE